MKQEDFWMGDADFFAGMMSKVTDLSKNLYLLVTDLQKKSDICTGENSRISWNGSRIQSGFLSETDGTCSSI